MLSLNHHHVIPAAYLLHERKFETAHKAFMTFIKKNLSSLSNVQSLVPIVTDNEKAVCNAIDKTLTGVVRLSCWNHIINSVKLWLRRHWAKSDEIPVYVSNLRELFHEPTYKAYLGQLETLKVNWSKAFLDYYNENIHVEVCIGA